MISAMRLPLVPSSLRTGTSSLKPDGIRDLIRRTVIGQRYDGAFLLMVLDGRQPSSFGSTYQDIIDIMQQYDAVNAANLDGGNSTVMVYDGETLNTTVSIKGDRRVPTAFIVK